MPTMEKTGTQLLEAFTALNQPRIYDQDECTHLADLIHRINVLKRERNAVILAHNYQRPEIFEVADFVGDSLELARKGTSVAADVIAIPWDKVDDYHELAGYAASLDVGIGAINTNVFQDDDYKLGSVTNPDAGIRRKATDHLLEAVDIMDRTGSRDLKLWFSDGINYPGQDDLRNRQDRLAAALGRLGIDVGAPDGINLWLPVRDERAALVYLAAEGIAVAGGRPFVADPAPAGQFVRVTAGAITENVRLVAEALARAAAASPLS